MRAGLSTGLVVAALAVLLFLRRFVVTQPLPLTRDPLLNSDLSGQLAGLVLVVVTVLGVRLLGSPSRLLRKGNLRERAEGMRILTITAYARWSSVIRNLAVLTAGSAAAVIIWQMGPPTAAMVNRLHFALLLSVPLAAVNAAVEEGLVRLALLEGVLDHLGKKKAALLSAALLAAFHLPGGIPGAVIAALMGLVLARSVVETGGVFGAWLVHFFHDVVVFTLLFLLGGRTLPLT